MMFNLTPEQILQYQTDGYLIVPNFLSIEEVNKLYHIAIEDENISRNSYDLSDRSGKRTKLALWYKPGNDIYSLLTRSKRVVNAVDQLADGTSGVCHFHSKLMQKEPLVGGAWEWHQDYGYWYKNEFLYPGQMLSVMFAITESTKANGCLQVIKGSHKMGRIEHGFAGDQVGASQHYVGLALKTMELVYVELKAGDALFFHSNLLHRSAANTSNKARWSLISCYNRQENKPYNESSTSCITIIDRVGDDEILSAAGGGIAADADFLHKDSDEALK